MLYCFLEVPECLVPEKVRLPLEKIVEYCKNDLRLPAMETVYMRKSGPEDRGPFVFVTQDATGAAVITAIAMTTPPRLLVRIDGNEYPDALCISAAKSLLGLRRTLDGQGDAQRVENEYAKRIFYKLFGRPALYVPEIITNDLNVYGVFKRI